MPMAGDVTTEPDGAADPVFTWDELAQIAHRASSLQSRMTRAWRPDPSAQPDPRQVKRRLDRWRVATGGDDDRFRRRLRWDGLTIDDAEALLGPMQLVEGEDLPAWVCTLGEVAVEARAHAGGWPGADWLVPGAPAAFEEILAPFVCVASRALTTRHPALERVISVRGRTTLHRHLLLQLAQTAFKTLQLEMAIRRLRAKSPNPFGVALSHITGSTDDDAYSAFVRELLSNGYRVLFHEYPVLARLLVTIVHQWVEATSELAERIEADLPALRSTFSDSDVSRADDFRVGLSDPHNGGRRVVGVRFDSGLKLMYKPKDLGPDVAFNALLEWCNRAGVTYPLRTLRVLRRKDWGWVEFAEPRPSEDDAALARYYRRAGTLLGVVYALRGTDFHFENVLACGDQPLFVDLETLLEPRLRFQADTGPGKDPFQGREALGKALEQCRESVLSTHFIPTPTPIQGGQVLDLSGLGAVGVQETERWILEGVNTDAMRAVRRKAPLATGANSPFRPEAAEDLTSHVEDLVSGFEEATALLASGGEYLLTWWKAHLGPDGAAFRLVFRSTWVYSTLQDRTLEPRYLQDGADRGIELDALTRAFTRESERPPLWPLIQAELRDMEEADVPFLTVRPGETHIRSKRDGSIVDALLESPWESLRHRWADLGPRARGVQALAIRSTVHSHAASNQTAGRTFGLRLAVHDPARCIEVAEGIGADLRRRAVVGSDGSAAWVGLHHDPLTHRSSYRPLGDDLYGGAGGVLLYLAALERVRPNNEAAAFIGPAIDSWVGAVREGYVRAMPKTGSGPNAGVGADMGSMIYVLTRLGTLTGRQSCFAAALELAEELSAQPSERVPGPGVRGKAASHLFGLMGLHRATGSPEPLETAVRFGHDLVRDYRPAGDGWSWPDGDSGQGGFLRGPDGIACALGRLGSLAGTGAFDAIATRIHASGARNASGGEAAERNDARWCSGAAGSLLARLGRSSDPGSRGDLDLLLDRVLRGGTEGADGLCCGTMGRVATLVTAGLRLGRSELIEAAGARAARVIQRADAQGTFRYFPQAHGPIESPGLFVGDAGIGYALLRLVAPSDVPCVLSSE